MGETFVQLPPNSTGIEIRVLSADATNLIPAGATEEVVIESDAQGLMSGDARQQPRAVTDQTMQEVLLELRRHTLLLSMALNVDIPSAGDALILAGG